MTEFLALVRSLKDMGMTHVIICQAHYTPSLWAPYLKLQLKARYHYSFVWELFTQSEIASILQHWINGMIFWRLNFKKLAWTWFEVKAPRPPI